MNSKDVIRISIETADTITRMYLDDLTDEEMMHRPHERCNHVTWQLGHLITADHEMVNGCFPGTTPELPPGFKQQYDKEKCRSDDPNDFHSKADLMKLFAAQRQAALEKLNQLTDDELDTPTPESMAAYAPTLGATLAMIGIHWMMHAGQWAVIRRQLGRDPVL